MPDSVNINVVAEVPEATTGGDDGEVQPISRHSPFLHADPQRRRSRLLTASSTASDRQTGSEMTDEDDESADEFAVLGGERLRSTSYTDAIVLPVVAQEDEGDSDGNDSIGSGNVAVGVSDSRVRSTTPDGDHHRSTTRARHSPLRKPPSSLFDVVSDAVKDSKKRTVSESATVSRRMVTPESGAMPSGAMPSPSPLRKVGLGVHTSGASSSTGRLQGTLGAKSDTSLRRRNVLWGATVRLAPYLPVRFCMQHAMSCACVHASMYMCDFNAQVHRHVTR